VEAPSATDISEETLREFIRRVAAVHWRFATGNCLRSISEQFGVSRAAIVRWTGNVSKFICE
jgi:hypothetical protein